MRGCLGCCVYKGVEIHYTIVCLEGGKGNEKIIISTFGRYDKLSGLRR